ncbi:Uncharacterised protein [Bordetella pertussis]|nr:Uncharacterised protein [Bordetella pertussis]
MVSLLLALRISSLRRHSSSRVRSRSVWIWRSPNEMAREPCGLGICSVANTSACSMKKSGLCCRNSATAWAFRGSVGVCAVMGTLISYSLANGAGRW